MAGGAAVEVGGSQRDRLLQRLGLTSSPDRSVGASSTPLVSGTLTSAYMPNPVNWTISTPPRIAGVVYCLHGRGGNHRFPFDEVRMPDFAAAAGASVAFAAVDGGFSSYWHPRADGTDAQAMLLNEFIPMVEHRLQVTWRALLGWSMGGYGALLAAETSPGRFRAVVAASPALWTRASATAPGAFDGAADYARHNVFARTGRLSGLTIRVDCGTGDSFYGADRRFASLLSPHPQGGFSRGFHDSSYWRSIAPGQISTLVGALGT